MSAAPKIPLEAEAAIAAPFEDPLADLAEDLEALAELGAVEVEIQNGVRRYRVCR